MGDIIYAGPCIRALGGGTLYLDPQGGLSSPLVKWQGRSQTRLNASTIEKAIPFLRMQPYLADVKPWNGEEADYDLDQFRQHIRFNNLSDSHLAIFMLPFSERDKAWLTVDAPTRIQGKPYVIARNFRYQGNDSFWEANLPAFADKAVFVGHPLEHEVFEHTFGWPVQYISTPTLLDLARVIAGCDQFMGNEGLPRAIAEGFKRPLINEYGRLCPNTIFRRPDAQYV